MYCWSLTKTSAAYGLWFDSPTLCSLINSSVIEKSQQTVLQTLTVTVSFETQLLIITCGSKAMCSVCWLILGITNLHEKQVPGVPRVWLRCWFCDSCVLEVFQLFSVNGLLRGLSQIEANQNMISPSWRTSGAELSHSFPPQCVWEGRGAAWSPFLFFLSFIFPLTFCRLNRAGCDFCFPLPRWNRPVLSLCPQSLWQPGQLWWCCCRAHLPKRCCRGFCSSSWIPTLLLLKPPRNSGLGAAISSALHGLSLLHP